MGTPAENKIIRGREGTERGILITFIFFKEENLIKANGE